MFSLKAATLVSIAFMAGMMLVPSTNGTVSIGVGAAQARVGRPLTPGSVAGVARRTTRRTVRRNVVGHGVYAPAVRCGYYPYPRCY
jgi:hypothetical protein